MSSAFRRAGAKKTAAANKASLLSPSSSLFGARGVKPWTGGIHLTDNEQGGGSVGSGVRSGGGKMAEPKHKRSGGMGCASNLSGSMLDF
jgi:hypothetical protein